MSDNVELRQEIERLRAENASLSEYKEKCMFLERASQEGILVFDEELKCLQANEPALEILGYSAEEIVGREGLTFVAPEYKDLVLSNVKLVVSEPYQVRIINRWGEYFWGLLQTRRIKHAGQELLVVSYRDITECKQLQDEALLKSAEFETIFNNTQVGIALVNSERVVVRANQKMLDIFEVGSQDEVVGRSVRDFHISDESYIAFKQYYENELLAGKIVKTEVEFGTAENNKVWVSVSGCMVDKSDPPSFDKGVVWVFEDITEKKKAEAALKRAYSELEIIFDNALMGILLLDSERMIVRTNQVFATMFGYDSPDELEGESSAVLHATSDGYDEFGAKYYEESNSDILFAGDIRVKKKDGTEFWVAGSGKQIDYCESSNCYNGILWSVMDINKRKETEAKLIELSRIDSLTEIYNRRYFYELAELELAVHKRYNRGFAYAIMDIDFFKKINDKFGHGVGDRTLRYLCKIVKSTIRHTDIFGRIGGEEFGLCLLEVDHDRAVSICEKIRMSISKHLPDMNEGIPLVTVSIGVVSVMNEEDIEMAAKRADRLLYEAKNNGRNKVVS